MRRVSKTGFLRSKRPSKYVRWSVAKARKLGFMVPRPLRYTQGHPVGTKSNGFGFPAVKVVRCVYHAYDPFTMPDAVAGTAVLQTGLTMHIRMNDPYDPCTDIAGVFNDTSGGYELFSSYYNRYVVLGSKLVVKLMANGVYNGGENALEYTATPLVWGVKLDDDDTFGFAGWEAAACDKNVKWKTFKVGLGDQCKSQKITVKYSPRKWFGVQDVRDSTDASNIGSTTGSSPGRLVYAIPFFQYADKVTPSTLRGFGIEVFLYQTVQFMLPKDTPSTLVQNED